MIMTLESPNEVSQPRLLLPFHYARKQGVLAFVAGAGSKLFRCA